MHVPFLQPGDTIGIAATARKISKEEIAPAVGIFESWGLRVKLSSTLFETDHQFAGDDATRARGFQELLDDASVKAIICARGGYGTVRMIDQLDFSRFTQHPKWIIGYSDITVLHTHIHQQFHIPTIHGTMPINMQPEKADEESIELLKYILFGSPLKIKTPAHPLNRTGEASGILVGGNLSVIYSTTGSVSDIDTNGKILFLEDLDEYLYHIDRMMMNLKRSGKLSHLKALVVGGMSDMKDNTVPYGKNAEEIIFEHVAEYHYPVCFGFPAGHQLKNLPLMVGGEYQLRIGENQTMLDLIQQIK